MKPVKLLLLLLQALIYKPSVNPKVIFHRRATATQRIFCKCENRRLPILDLCVIGDVIDVYRRL